MILTNTLIMVVILIIDLYLIHKQPYIKFIIFQFKIFTKNCLRHFIAKTLIYLSNLHNTYLHIYIFTEIPVYILYEMLNFQKVVGQKLKKINTIKS